MPDLLPRPAMDHVVKCPSCGHAIDDHDRRYPYTGCTAGHIFAEECMCLWTPNDIAYHLLFAGLTKTASPRPQRSLPW